MDASDGLDDAALWAAFTGKTLTHAQWTHRAHLRVAWLHLSRWSLDEAHLRMRAAIIRLNEVHGLEETPARGYFETLTRVWLVLVAAARRERACESSLAFLDASPSLLDREAPLRFYSRERLMTAHARSVWVAPDRAPLPEL
ncbi:hypothetical protein [Sandaracinus amylolyticus]|uniref:hypothetical protein n=1 Tax=Sandaracinus amylolyticus TaxID=927083 RepID=UPI001F274B01|nr:hypothetical protein [Sandaracinus amylolyticus]UJR81707.1 Peptidyl-tRNA hydrolase, archaeal type [Sandaracinus amylolyticus]